MKVFDCGDQNLRKKLELNLSEFVVLHNIYERTGGGKWHLSTSKKEISEYFDITRKTVYSHLAKLIKSGYLRKDGHGKIYITERLIRAL
jgi:predicted transcriptional regulator